MSNLTLFPWSIVEKVVVFISFNPKLWKLINTKIMNPYQPFNQVSQPGKVKSGDNTHLHGLTLTITQSYHHGTSLLKALSPEDFHINIDNNLIHLFHRYQRFDGRKFTLLSQNILKKRPRHTIYHCWIPSIWYWKWKMFP